MIVQRTFKKGYVDALASAVKAGQNLELYSLPEFPYDSDQVVMIPTLVHPVGLLGRMIPTPQGDFESAVALYEAYPGLPPLLASDASFWTYLSHTELFSYVQKRYPKVLEPDFNDIPYVYNHWFFGGDWYWRHPLASLWWFVHLTIDNDATDWLSKYKYTRFFFTNYAFRTNFVKYSIARHKDAVFGYFDFLMDNPDVFSQFPKFRNNFIAKHLNKMGGTRLLSTLPRETFYEELVRIKPQILKITNSATLDPKDDDDFYE